MVPVSGQYTLTPFDSSSTHMSSRLHPQLLWMTRSMEECTYLLDDHLVALLCNSRSLLGVMDAEFLKSAPGL
jgi:hypothetical protein